MQQKKRFRRLVFTALGLCALALGGCSGERLSSHGRFAHINVTQPPHNPEAVVLLLSGAGGPNDDTRAFARTLADRGALVATLDTPAFLATFAGDTDCASPDGNLDNLSRHLEAAYDMPGYRPPILAGIGEGATLAFATLAQAGSSTFAGALSQDFNPQITLPIQPCNTGALATDKAPDGVRVRPAPQLQAPWFVLAPSTADKTITDFVRQTGHAEIAVTSAPRQSRNSGLTRAYRAIEKRQIAHATTALAPAVADLPLVEIKARPGARSDTMAIMLSGDGGWAGLDRDIGQALAANGIPVVGYDTLRYYWKPRTPAEAANDLARVIDYYRAQWHKRRVLLVGYSLGADVMPFLVNRLPTADCDHVVRVVMLGLSSNVQFEFHVWNWLGLGEGGRPIKPEVALLPPGLGVCIYGTDDDDSICRQLDPAQVKVIALAGGHHFDGDYARLARLIVGALPGKAASAPGHRDERAGTQ